MTLPEWKDKLTRLTLWTQELSTWKICVDQYLNICIFKYPLPSRFHGKDKYVWLLFYPAVGLLALVFYKVKVIIYEAEGRIKYPVIEIESGE